MNTPRATSNPSRRTRLITATSIVAVALAGAFAVSANLGILNRTQKNPVGTLATADLTTTIPQAVNVQLNQTASAASAVGATGTQDFVVDVAGTVTLAAANDTLGLAKVAPTSGWTWTLSQTDLKVLKVTFTNGTRTLEFTGTLKPDGTVDAAVNEPITQAAPAANSGNGGGEHENEHEYEGGGDDD